MTNVPADPSRTSTFTSGTLQKWSEKEGSATVKAVNTKKTGETASDDDEEEGWAEMKKTREKKKSAWRSKKGGAEVGHLKDVIFGK